MAWFQIVCQQCGHHLKYRKDQAGKRVQCLKCASWGILPVPPENDQAGPGPYFVGSGKEPPILLDPADTILFHGPATQKLPFILESVQEVRAILRTACPDCGRKMKYREHEKGHDTQCFRCGHCFQLPVQAERASPTSSNQRAS